jgi:SAM-dependent methyltransferase
MDNSGCFPICSFSLRRIRLRSIPLRGRPASRPAFERTSGYARQQGSVLGLHSMSDEKKDSATLNRETFQTAYAGSAPWEIGKPQPAFHALADTISGSVLDAGCGTGENALLFASRGHEVTGFDFLEVAVNAAKQKAAERGVAARFLVEDALKLQRWTERFDNVIDSGLFHVFSNEDRASYVLGLKTVLKRDGRLFLLCFSDRTPGTQGPRRVSKDELEDAFAEGWKIESIEPARFHARPEQRLALFSGEDPHAWLLIARRTA